MITEDEALTGPETAEEGTSQNEASPVTIENKAKSAAVFLRDTKFIDEVCKVYVLEFLSNFDDDGANAWADRLNSILNEYRSAPGFEFLTGKNEDNEEYARQVDPAKYDNFKTAKLGSFQSGAVALREILIRMFQKENLPLIRALIQSPNSVLLDDELATGRDQGVTNVTTNNFENGVNGSVLNFPSSANINLDGLNIWAFLLFGWETGLYTKDYDRNAPSAIPSVYNKVTTGKFIQQAWKADQESNDATSADLWWMPIYKINEDNTLALVSNDNIANDEVFKDMFDHLPAPVAGDGGSPQSLLRWTGEKIYNTYGPRGAQGSESNAVPKYQLYPIMNTLDQRVVDKLYYSIGRSFSIGAGEFGGYLASAGGNIPGNSAAFQSIYKKCLEVIASIATLYSNKTIEQFQDVLENLIDKAEKNPEANFFADPNESKKRPPRTSVRPEAVKPSDHQCFLLENIRPIASAKDNLQKQARTRYKNLGAIYGTIAPGNITSRIQHGGKTDQVDALLNLCPEIYALLTPFIEVYRVEYKKDDKKKLRPVRQAKIPFPNFIDPKDIDAITSGQYGRFPGAGIKSFTWSLDGVQPAEVDNNISAKLELHFQTIQDLFSLNTNTMGAGGKEPGYLDLIIASPGVDDNQSGTGPGLSNASSAGSKPQPISAACFEAEMMDFDPRNFEIKVCAGWSVPPNFENIVNELESFRDLGPDYGKKLQNAIMESNIALFLTLTEHELNFNENGSVDLNVFYQARLSGLTRSPAADIFASSNFNDPKIENIDKKIKKIDKQRKKIQDRELKNQKLSGDTQALESLDKKLKNLLEKKSELEKLDKGVKYKKFLDRLYCSNKIYSYRVNQKRLLRDEDSAALRALKAKRRTGTQQYKSYAPQQATGASATLYEEAAKQIQDISLASSAGDDTSARRARGRRALAAVKGLDEQRKLGSGTLDIPFFYLGDLIDEVVGHVGDLTDRDHGALQIILSEVELLDPLQAYQIKQISIECPDDRTKKIVRAISDIDPMRYTKITGISFKTNIGSIPISLEFFQEWFINNVVKTQAEKYNLLRFIKTVCSALISRAFNSMCFEGGPKFSLRFDTATFNFDRSFAGQNVTSTRLAESKSEAQRKNCSAFDKNKKPSIPAFIISSIDSRPLTGNYDKDLSNGIYHYYLGASCGIAKSIKFDRVGIPYYREARLQRTSALSALQLREMYNVNMDMVGNTIHKNGQYIYVNPVAIGAGSAKTRGTVPNLARLLGIGGYYMVTGVTHTVSSAGFNVSLKAIQEGIDFSNNQTVHLIRYLPKSTPKASSAPEPQPAVAGGASVPGGPD